MYLERNIATGFTPNTGYFLFSLDTELAWGHFDCFPSAELFTDASEERIVIKRLLDIFDRYQIAATWALVGHMFYRRCEKCSQCPIMDWKGKYPAFEQIFESENPLWYGSDIVDTLLNGESVHEIAFHGYTHKVFDELILSEEDAKLEIDEWIRLSRLRNLVPTTVIFPRNKVGFLPLFIEKGFICYRGDQLLPKAFTIPIIGKALKWFDSKTQFFIPEVYDVVVEPNGLVNLPSSRRLLGIDHRLSAMLEKLHLNEIGIRRIIKSLKRAARENKVLHIRAHPYEFKTERDFEKLELLLDSVSSEIKKHRMQSVTMSKLAQLYLKRS